MGASLGGGGGRGGYSRRRTRPMSDINVTPLVDVMLVLLIIFMVTAPMLTTGVPVELPKANAPSLHQKSEDQPLEVTVADDGRIYLMKSEVTIDELVPRMKAIAANRKDDRVYFRAYAKADYGSVAKVWAALVQGGFTKLAVLTDPSSPAPVPVGKPRG